MMRGLLEAFKVQRRVWMALFMREMQTRWGRRNLGFAWLFAEPLVFAFPVLWIWSMIRAPYEHGVPMTTFIWSGYMPLLIFRHVSGRALFLIKSNAALLYHSRITPFDIFVGSCGLEAIGNLASVAFSYVVLYVMGLMLWPYDIPLFVLGFVYMAWWALDVALIVTALSERFEIVGHIWMVISYVYIIVSGFMFMAYWLPDGVRGYALTYDVPLMCYETIRAGFYGNYVPTYSDVPYLTSILSILSLIGLWLMHHVRQHVQVS
jgi:capsular polysaccharide transport system permease protein